MKSPLVLMLLILLLSTRAAFSRTSEAEDAMRELLDKYLSGDLGHARPHYALNGQLSERDINTIRGEMDTFAQARTEREKREALEVIVKVLMDAPIYMEGCANLLDELLGYCVCEEYLVGYCETDDRVCGYLCQKTCCHCAEADEDICQWFSPQAIQAACQQESLQGAFWRSNCPELCEVECQVGCAPEVDLPYVNCEFYASYGMCDSSVQYFGRFMNSACKDTCNTCSCGEDDDDDVCFSPIKEATFDLMPEAMSLVGYVEDPGSPDGCMAACQDEPECSFWIYKDLSLCLFYNPLAVSAFIDAEESGEGFDMGPRQCGEDCVAQGILFAVQSVAEAETSTVDECRDICSGNDWCFFWTAEQSPGSQAMHCRLYGEDAAGQIYTYTGENDTYLGPRTCPGE